METVNHTKAGEPTTNSGFTLVELLIAMIVSTLIMASVFGAYKAQQSFSLDQEQITDMQQNIRSGLNILAREARYAGYDPDGNGYTITTADNDTFIFTLDNDDGGSTTRTFSLDSPGDADANDTTSVYITAGGSPIANNIERLQFVYLDEDNNTIALPVGTMSDIRSLEIHMLARADEPDDNFNNGFTYPLPYGDYTPGDNYRRRLQIMTVKLRNMGLSDE